jgi:hypothetical protein
MKRVTRFVVRPLVVGPIVVVLVASAIGAFALRDREPSQPAAATYKDPNAEPEVIKPLYRPPVLPIPTPTLRPKPAPPKPKPKTVKREIGPNLSAFRGLGAWVDLYDYDKLDPETSVADMHAKGVKTLYVQTARWNKPAKDLSEPFMDRVILERWLNAAHTNGMKAVGWYLPAYDDMTRDIRRTRAIALYRTSTGQAFDALGIDIEYRAQVPSLTVWNAAVAEHGRRVRILLGHRYPIAAIVPAPLQMEVRPDYWAGFPWVSLASSSDIFMPMAYWSFRHDCADNPEHCAYGYTKGSVDKIRALTGKPHVPVHVIGGVADSISTDEVHDFVAAAVKAGVYGGSLYDYLSTKPEYWAPLAKLND